LKTEENYLIVEKTTRYYSNVPENNKLNSLWIVIHGYAQLAREFIEEFEFLSDAKALIIAPEGLSRFYFKNKIGASWMTKEDRLNEINDYVNYLDKIYAEVNNRYELSASKINLLGFSQGVHTAVRWFIKSKNKFDNLFLCSSDFPKDADFIKLINKLNDSKLYYLFGDKDEVISREKFNESLDLLRFHAVPLRKIIFEGKHNIDMESISAVINNKSHSK
jgi:predicted esterase